MSYHIYTTRGLVLAERPVRESDRIYTILTRDLGLVSATALGARKESSKLRPNIEPLVLSSVAFVKGKDYWRLTSAECIQVINASPYLARPLKLIEKLIQGEESHPELFDIVEQFAISSEPNDEMFEIHMVSQILFHLGYLKEADLMLDKKELIKAINDGIQHSHLT